MSGRGPNVAASVRWRLLNLARARSVELEYLLNRYANERLLYRLGQSPHADLFVLKGATLFSLWAQILYRATRDLDFLGHGDPHPTTAMRLFRDLCMLSVPDDGLVFLPESVRGEAMREDEAYRGVRVKLVATLGQARIPMQADIGFGDAVTPDATEAELPTLLDFPRPHLLVYPRETVVAEKFEAMVALGITNSRMKDFYDLWRLLRDFAFDGTTLTAALRATFARRQTLLPIDAPTALTPAFTDDESKRRQWEAFVRRGGIAEHDLLLPTVTEAIQEFVLPPAYAVAAGQSFMRAWPVGGPWTDGAEQG